MKKDWIYMMKTMMNFKFKCELNNNLEEEGGFKIKLVNKLNQYRQENLRLIVKNKAYRE